MGKISSKLLHRFCLVASFNKKKRNVRQNFKAKEKTIWLKSLDFSDNQLIFIDIHRGR